MLDVVCSVLIIALQIMLFVKLNKIGAIVPKYQTEEKARFTKPFAKQSKKRKPIANDDAKAWQKEQENVST